MVFSSPNAGTPAYPAMSEIFAVHWDVLAAALGGVGVISGCAVSQRGAGANMSVDVAAGSIVSPAWTEVDVAAVNVAVTAADSTNPRFDLVKVNSAGVVSVAAGTPAAYVDQVSTPVPPTIGAGDVALGLIYVPAGATTVVTNTLLDLRAVVLEEPQGSLELAWEAYK